MTGAAMKIGMVHWARLCILSSEAMKIGMVPRVILVSVHLTNVLKIGSIIELMKTLIYNLMVQS